MARAKSESRAATITVTFASGVTGGKANIGEAVTITTSVAFATITEVDWGDGTTNTSATHTYSAAAAGVTVNVTDGTDTGTSSSIDVIEKTNGGGPVADNPPLSSQASNATITLVTVDTDVKPPPGPLHQQELGPPKSA